jgi:hypothetical protein
MLQLVRTLQPAIAEKLPVFGSEEFLSAKSPEYGWFISENFVLPFVVDARLRKVGFKRIMVTTEPVALRSQPSVDEEQSFLEDVLQACEGRDISADSIATQANAVFRTVPSGVDTLPWGSYLVDLRKTENAIFDSFDSAHKNRIRKAIKDGVAIASTKDVAMIYHNIKETMDRQHLLFYPSKRYLLELQQKLQQNITFHIAEKDHSLQGVAVVLHNKLGAYYYYGGSIAEPSPGSLTLLHYEIIKDLKTKGVPVYDLMGARLSQNNDAKIEGIQRFKRRFASSMRAGFCFRKVLHPLRYRMMISTIKTFFFLKGSQYEGDVFDQARRVEACTTA